MAYAFNEDRSKVEVYSKQQSDSIESITNARIDTLVNSGFGGIEVREELWAASTVAGEKISNHNSGSTGLALLNSASNYDCLELEVGTYNGSGQNGRWKHLVRVQTDDASGGHAGFTNSFAGGTDIANDNISVIVYTYNDNPVIYFLINSNNGTYSTAQYVDLCIYSVYGIKYAQDCSAEVADIRVGYDDTVYTTAGEAIRSQIDDIHTILDNIIESINSNAL